MAASTFYRVTPLFRDAEGNLEDSVQTSLIDGELKDAYVVRVPASCSVAKANEIERELTQRLGKPCLVVTRNIEICRVELVDPKELTTLLRGVDRNAPIEEERRTIARGASISAALQNARAVRGEPDADAGLGADGDGFVGEVGAGDEPVGGGS